MRTARPATITALASLLAGVLNVALFGQASFNTSYPTTDFSGEWSE